MLYLRTASIVFMSVFHGQDRLYSGHSFLVTRIRLGSYLLFMAQIRCHLHHSSIRRRLHLPCSVSCAIVTSVFTAALHSCRLCVMARSESLCQMIACTQATHTLHSSLLCVMILPESFISDYCLLSPNHTLHSLLLYVMVLT